MNIFKKLYYMLYKHINYIGYAKAIGVKIGDDSRIMGSSFGTEPYLITIGNHVSISSNCTFITHEGAHWVLKGLNKKYNSFFGYEE